MKPAFSVIFLTTLIGAGQGLFLALFTQQSYALFDLLPKQDDAFYGYGSLLALLLLVAGLAASFFHLGHPERAWRTAAMWRTSWLSREVIALPAFMGVVFLYGVTHLMNWKPVLITLPSGLAIDLTIILGDVGTVSGLRAVHLHRDDLCLPALPARMAFAADGDQLHPARRRIRFHAGRVLCRTGCAVAGKILRRLGADHHSARLDQPQCLAVRNARLRPTSTIQTAIGIKHPHIVQKSQGAMGGSFNTREFFHGKSAEFMRALKPSFLLLAFGAPSLLLIVALSQPAAGILGMAFVLQYIGLLAERWFFFAQANHPQNIYYQGIS